MLTKCPPLRFHLMVFLSSLLETSVGRQGTRQGFKEKQHGSGRPAVQQQLGHSHQTLWRADESCSIQGSSEHKLFNNHSPRTHTNSLNIPTSHFHVWLLTRMDTEGDVTLHTSHHKLPTWQNRVLGENNRVWEWRPTSCLKGFRGKEGKHPLKPIISSSPDKLLSCSCHTALLYAHSTYLTDLKILFLLLRIYLL